MRFFALAAIMAVCGMLASAVPTVGIQNISDTGIAVGSSYNNTQPVHTAQTKTITLALGTNGINVGNSQTLYHDVINAIEYLCPPSGEGCFNTAATFNVWVTSRGLNPYLSRTRKTITVFVEDADWGGRADVYEVMRNVIAAAFERGTYDLGNCAGRKLYQGGKEKVFRDCMTVDYAEVVLSGGLKMKVRFGGPKSEHKDLRFDCERVVDDAFVFVRDDVEWKGTPWVYCIGVELWPRGVA